MSGSAFPTAQIADWFAEAGLDLEETLEFEPRAGADRALTVKLWLGRDRRLLIADPAAIRSREGDRLMSQFRFSRRPHIGDKVRVSFEFFPPKTDEMEARLWDTVTQAAAAEAAFRVGDLRRRRLDARAHAAHRAPHPARNRR